MGVIADEDVWGFSEGTHPTAYRFMGAHPAASGAGFRFHVWAPDAANVDVVGDFNGWTTGAHRAFPVGSSGIWTCDVREAAEGHRYKYRLHLKDSTWTDKADPYGAMHDQPPSNASVLYASRHRWRDGRWMNRRGTASPWASPVSIYEVHLGSFTRDLDDGPLYRAVARRLVEHVVAHGFTHVELLPVMEHPFYGSWGYQVTGYFAPTSRYGTPDDLRYLIDALHQAGVGVILDWVPAHFPGDEHGLARFDGTALYEHADPRRGWHPDWGTHIFNFGRNEVRSFLLSSADYWLSEFHADGLRVDAVASMLYLDYSREAGAWIPNELGGNENLEAISLLRTLNEQTHARHPGVLMVAEESTAWGGVSRPTSTGGLGFGFKWDMGWMHDTLQYLARDPIHRRYHHGDLTFRSVYANSENFVLALSHDEVVHGKGSLPRKMPGDEWQRYANVRLLFAWQFAQPGKKLLFMGMEMAQWDEWAHEGELAWRSLNDVKHAGCLALVAALNKLYRTLPTLHQTDHDAGRTSTSQGDGDVGVLVIERHGRDAADAPVFACFNFTPVVRSDVRVGVPRAGRWRELLNTDDSSFGGSGCVLGRRPTAEPIAWGGHAQSVLLTLPPLGAVWIAPWGGSA